MGETSPSAESELLRRMAGGDCAALGEFYDQHGGTLFALAFRILHDASEAQDVVQEAFVQLWEKASVFDPALGRPLSWILTLTRNRAIDRLRSAQRRARLVTDAGAEADGLCPGGPPPVAGMADAREEAELVRAALGRLPAEQRQAIEMAYFDGLSQSEIAAALAKPLGTVKARIRRGMQQLRDELAPLL